MADSDSPELFLRALGMRTKTGRSSKPLVGLPATKLELRPAESAIGKSVVALESKPGPFALADEILPHVSNRFGTETVPRIDNPSRLANSS